MATTIYTPVMLRGAGTRGVPEIPVGSTFDEYSLSFDGVDARLILEGDVDLGRDEVTVSFWVKRGATGNTEMILGNDAVSGATVIKFIGTTSMQFKAYGIATFNNAATQTALARTDWMHVLFTLDSSNACILYIDGALTETGTGAPNSYVIFDKIGIGQVAGYPAILANAFTGNIDEVSGFKSKLGAADIAKISASPIDLNTELSVTPYWWSRMGDGATYPDIPDVQGGYSGSMTDMIAGDIVADVP